MELRFAHLADYASADASGKITIVGIFDLVYDRLKARPIPFPPCYLAATFASSVAEGSAHRLELRFADADEKDIIDPVTADLHFRPFGPGYPQKSAFIVGFGADSLKVPHLGDYHFSFIIDGVERGRVAVTVLDPPPGT
jgi:hypothetical protein